MMIIGGGLVIFAVIFGIAASVIMRKKLKNIEKDISSEYE